MYQNYYPEINLIFVCLFKIKSETNERKKNSESLLLILENTCCKMDQNFH